MYNFRLTNLVYLTSNFIKILRETLLETVFCFCFMSAVKINRNSISALAIDMGKYHAQTSGKFGNGYMTTRHLNESVIGAVYGVRHDGFQSSDSEPLFCL